MAHGIFTRNSRKLAAEIRYWQRCLHAARKEARVRYCRHMIEARLARLRANLAK